MISLLVTQLMVCLLNYKLLQNKLLFGIVYRSCSVSGYSLSTVGVGDIGNDERSNFF